MFEVASLLRKLFFIDKNYLCFSLFMLVLIHPAVVLGFGCVACCYWLSWRMLHKARQWKDKSSDIFVHFGMLYLSLGRKFMGKANQIITGSTLLTSEGGGMGECFQTVNKSSHLQQWLAWAAFFRSSPLDGPQGSGFWHIALLMVQENQVQKCCINSMSHVDIFTLIHSLGGHNVLSNWFLPNKYL